jgi:hypothetical protein
VPSRLPWLLGAALAVAVTFTAAAQDEPTAEDLRALRFYVEQGDTTAQAAELRRLRREFPEWEPPDDLAELTAEAPVEEERRIYELIADEDFSAAEALIEETRAENPGWTPPQEMARLLRLGRAQAAFDAAFAAGDVAEAARQAQAVPELLRCNRINNAWRLAEAQAEAGNEAAALRSYRSIVSTCTELPDIVSTLEKADAVASTEELRNLIDLAIRRFRTQRPTLRALEQRLLAGRGIDVDDAEEAAPARTARRQAPAQQRGAPTRIAPQPSSGPAALRLARLPRAGDPRLQSVLAAAQNSAWAACLARSVRPRALDVAYQRAWCAYNLQRNLEAIALFAAVLDSRIGGDVRRDARYGLTLALIGEEMTEEAARIAAAGDLTREQRRTVETLILDQRAVRAYAAEDYRRAIAFLDALEREGALRRDLDILRAYAYAELGQVVRARSAFRRLDEELSTPETRAALDATRPTGPTSLPITPVPRGVLPQ